uniref:Piwi domain-containing protein n=1 Tax=Steinernema glaseri TaxID=37863 RepID=A0A1I7Z033_9BILA
MEELTKSFADLKRTVTMAPKLPGQPNPEDRPVLLKTNILSLEMRKQMPVFMYHVDIFMKTERKMISLVKTSRSDSIAVDHKDKCRAAFRFAVRKYPMVFTNPSSLCYDLQAQLYSLDKLKTVSGSDLTAPLSLTIDQIDFVKSKEFDIGIDSIIVEIKPVEDSQVALGALMSTADLDNPCRELLQFIEVATSQHAYLTHSEFLTFPAGLSYRKPKNEAPKELDGGMQLFEGVRKSAKIIEGNPDVSKNGEVALLLDPKKAAFHSANMSVAKKVQLLGLANADGVVDPRDVKKVGDLLKGLFVETRYANKVRKFEINGVSKESAQTYEFQYNGFPMTVEHYYKRRYNVSLALPRASLARIKSRKIEGRQSGYIYLPMELLFVCPNQRVKSTQQTPKQISEMIRSCATLPADREKEINRHCETLRLNGPNAQRTLKTAQMHVDTSLMVVEGRALAPPSIAYKDDTNCPVDPFTGKWRSSGRGKPQYLVSASINKWELTMLCLGHPRAVDETLAQNFAAELLKECGARGMQANGPSAIRAIQYMPDELENIFIKAKQNGIQFLFFIEDSRLSAHKDIKFFERKYQIITQDLDQRNAINTTERGKWQSLENIVAKTNMKLGGVNYAISAPDSTIFQQGRLYLGFQVSHGAPLSPEAIERGLKPSMPTVIGVAGNVTKEPCAFVGDFFYQVPFEDKMIEAMDRMVADFAQRYIAAVGFLNEVVIYRNGTTEAQYANLLGREVPIIKKALKQVGAPNAKLTFVVVTKQHNTRIMPASIFGQKASEQNVKPGTVVDTKIVHPRYQEFYLNSHQAIQGSATTPRYTVVKDESFLTLSQLEHMTNVLCYGHQIVNLPTSLPCPLYIAGCYAERGALLLQGGRQNMNDMGDFKRLNTDLAFRGTALEKTRVNA